MFNNLIELIKSMPTEQACKEYLAQQRWNGKTVCPYCGHEKCYVIEGGKRYKCGSSKCYKRFTVTVGTIFEASNIPLSKWFTAIYMVTAHKRGISSYQLAKDIGITQKSAWFVLHRIREVLRRKDAVVLGETAPVEADETFVGGKYSNMHKKKRIPLLQAGDGFANKTTVLGMIERGGNVVVKTIPKNNQYQVAHAVAEVVKKNATLMTDGTNMYQRIASSYKHYSVNHSIFEYVRGFAHTNTVEGVFSHFKRMLIGTYFQISPKHTQRYCDEFAGRYNSRKVKDSERFVMAIQGSQCRLKWKELTATVEEIQEPIVIPQNSENRGKGVLQIKDGEIVGHYSSLWDAEKKTGIKAQSIWRICKGKKGHRSAGGFMWVYA